MSEPRITVGVPVYKGAAQIADALSCLQQQSFRDFEVIISVDGADEESATACRPFLADSRFRMIVQPKRLDWFGNMNWILQQGSREFFCYRQHDDTTSPDFFRRLIDTADSQPNAAAVYADCQWTGTRTDIEIAHTIQGAPLLRLAQYVEQLPAAPVRGLIRREAIAQAGPIRHDEFRGLTQIFCWLAKLLRWGDFIRTPFPIYYRLDHPDNFYKSWHGWPQEKIRAAWTTLFTGLMDAVMPVCRTPEERAFMMHLILDRVAVFRPDRLMYLYKPPNDPEACGALIGECFERLAYERQNNLLGSWRFPEIETFAGGLTAGRNSSR
jgi:glycosyltransferase involved in cell wall biosynthesis